MDRLSTHVLDTYRGEPVTGLEVRLERLAAGAAPDLLFQGATGEDGRLVLHAGPEPLPAGRYRLIFETGAFYARSGIRCRFPCVSLSIEAHSGQRYHLPLYIGPHTFTTYRGS